MKSEDDAKHLPQTTLDPGDWSAFRTRAHAMLDAAIDKMERAGDGPVWTPVDDDLKRQLATGLPVKGRGVDAADDAIRSLLPHGVGNTHPRFFGWVHGSGTPANLIADIAAAALNANAGGRDHAAIQVERQLIGWMRDLFSFPETANGLVTTGTSMATISALKAARARATDLADRTSGIANTRLVGYTSAEAHACNARAFDMLGLGTDALRRIPTDDAFRIDTAALQTVIDADRAAGLQPFAIIGTAGTVNTGAIDDLPALAAIAARENIWFHIDGAFAASGIMSDRLRPKLAGIELADSIAFDFHKWCHVNYDAGFVLVREGDWLRSAFTTRPDYLQPKQRGLAAGEPWPVEFGPELSRGFRALKVWAHFQEFGTKRLGASISANCDLIEQLAALVDADPLLQRLAPVQTSICCFRYQPHDIDPAHLDAINDEIVIRLQETGIAAPSTTWLNGKLAIRVNITNHRTRPSDLTVLIDAIHALAPKAIADVTGRLESE
ncbi:pyridoxal phosphate-dependent decarboxylase family protein [Henriciella litoralis]|uniref:pyridoxal phosphate-dependent decarboxylase family protein n=1 Tax=Henriciella litoralis TaxID=568102 RepID=UPI0018EF5BAD|nr:pyridoxal-dependent decarboxylase [Henriciella litoralis]